MDILFTSDLHLGRTPARVPEAWRGAVRTTRVWEQLVETALREKVGAVLLGGDVVDASNKYWEALGPLEHGAKTLGEAGIRLIAVAGNHDADVLPRLARRLPPEVFTLLGEGGRWEKTTLTEKGRPLLHLVGWSFPREHVEDDPTGTFPAPDDDGVPVLGMVHADLNASASRYAPLSLARLQSLPVSGWLLGHLHAPALHTGPPWVLMPGSPQPLDPSETGIHALWRIRCEGGSPSLPEPAQPASLLYEEIQIELTADSPTTEDFLRDAVRERLNVVDAPRVVLRLRVTGETRNPGDVEAVLRSVGDWEPRPGVVIDRVEQKTRPPLDLAACHKQGGAPGQLAALLVDGVPPGLAARLREMRGDLLRRNEFDGRDLAPAPEPDAIEAARKLLLELHAGR